MLEIIKKITVNEMASIKCCLNILIYGRICLVLIDVIGIYVQSGRFQVAFQSAQNNSLF